MTAKTGSAIPARIEAIEAYRKTRNNASQTIPALTATSGATAKKTPPQVATIFPPFSKRRKIGRQWPSIAAAPAQTPARWCGETKSIPSIAGMKPFSTSSRTTGIPSQRP